MNKRLFVHDERGVALITVMIVALILTTIALSLADLSIRQLSRTQKKTFTANAQLVSEAGIEETLALMNSTGTSGFATEQQFFNDSTEGRGTYQTVISAGTGQNEKIITSTGRVYRYNQSSNPVSTRITRVTVVGTSSSGYSVEAGVGGISLEGGANITNSSIFSNGALSLTGGAYIGTASQPLNINVANRGCVDSNGNYPSTNPCATQPISATNGTHIYDSSLCAAGLAGNPGNALSKPATSCDPGYSALPTYDRAAQIAAVTTTIPSTDNTIGCTGWKSGAPNNGFGRTWPANLEITNTTSSSYNVSSSCYITLKGNVYVAGSKGLEISGGAHIVVDDSLGTTRPVIIADGPIKFDAGATLVENSSGTSVQFVSFCAKATSSATCTVPSTPPTGTTLSNDAQQTTVSVAGGGTAPGALFYAYWGTVDISGSGTMGAAVGQRLHLSGGANVVFGTQLAVDRQTWTIRSYQREYQ